MTYNNIAFIFPGQGSQKVGMGRDFYDQYQEARNVFEEIDDTLHDKLSALIFSDDQEALNLTKNTQPALMGVSLAIIKILEKEIGKPAYNICSFVAGHSLGEYSALTAAGALSLADTAALLRFRGEAMQRAVPIGAGAMAAIIGLEYDVLLALLENIIQETHKTVTIANDNSDGQIVISGLATAVDDAIIAAKNAGAKRAVLLPVSAPFHCPLMQPAADEMSAMLDNINCHDMTIPIFANVTAAPETKANSIIENLKNQICAPVRWRETMINMAQKTTNFTEIGAGKVLSGLIKRQIKDVNISNIDTINDLKIFLDNYH